MQTRAIKAPPVNETDCTQRVQLEFIKVVKQRHIPNPPNFNRMAAKIMEPTKGASTWALGSQR